ncbi:hypothetical protein RUM43_013243 [Polyplax serrata]|uniref:Proteasome subunit beta n=1 Tax=Polyplax serrata TaxID=468196 RepID=A0AAN8NK68_POLSC
MAFFGLNNFPDLTGTGVGFTGLPMSLDKVTPTSDYGFQRSKEPITTASSVLGIKFNGGVIIAADTLGSYGTLARFRDCPRVFKVNKNIIVGAGGDYADFQYLKEIIMQKVIDEDCIDDGFHMKPKALYHWLTRVLYTRRTQLDPLWNNYVIGGIQDGQPFLGTVDKLGTAFVDNHVATGFGAYLAIPIMRAAMENAEKSGRGLTKDEATNLIYKCVEVLYYRDAKSWPKFQLGIIEQNDISITGPFTIEGSWDVAALFHGYE